MPALSWASISPAACGPTCVASLRISTAGDDGRSVSCAAAKSSSPCRSGGALAGPTSGRWVEFGAVFTVSFHPCSGPASG